VMFTSKFAVNITTKIVSIVAAVTYTTFSSDVLYFVLQYIKSWYVQLKLLLNGLCSNAIHPTSILSVMSGQ